MAVPDFLLPVQVQLNCLAISLLISATPCFRDTSCGGVHCCVQEGGNTGSLSGPGRGRCFA